MDVSGDSTRWDSMLLRFDSCASAERRTSADECRDLIGKVLERNGLLRFVDVPIIGPADAGVLRQKTEFSNEVAAV
jgi:hypothetical protein